MNSRSFLPLAAPLLFGCSLRRGPVAPEPAIGPARDSLFRLDQTRADSVTARGMVDGGLSLFGAGVVYLRAGVPAVYGRDAVRALLSAAPSADARHWEPLGGGVAYDLRHAYTYGVAVRVPSRPTSLELDRYIAYWTRERGQPWRISAYAEVNGLAGAEVRFTASQLAPPTASPPRQIAALVASVRTADSVFSDLADRMGAAVAFERTAAKSGVVFGPSQLLIGPEAIGDYFRSRPAGTSVAWRPVYAAVAGSADMAITIGESIRTERGASGAAEQHFGKYLTVWVKQRDGSWKFAVDGGSATPPRSERP